MAKKQTILLCALACLCCARPFAETKTAAPNIIVILADDLGYSDLGCYGGEMATPALDRLAEEGIRMSHFHNGGMCVLSRSCLMTGNYYPKMKKDFARTPILPELLKEKGYRTALIGKWHLRGHPLDRGFDRFFGYLGGAGTHFGKFKGYQLDREDFDGFGKDFYSADAQTDHAIDFIENPAKGAAKKPFFLYLSYQTPHSPLMAPKEDIMKNRGSYLAGWQAVREARFARQKQMGIVPANATLPDYPKNLPAWESLSPEQKDLEDLRMSVYAAMVERMDQGILRVMKTLEATGQADNTLILFMSDNGTDPFSSADANMLKKGLLPGDPNTNYQPGIGWAYASVTPWRQYKVSQHRGGITTGAIAWWPGRTGKPGRITHGPVHMIDVLPTMMEVVGVPPSKPKVDGESFLPLLLGSDWKRKEPLYFQFVDNRAIRTEEWTLAEVDLSGWQLYRAKDDPLENRDLSAQYPEIVATLDRQWNSWWTENSGEDSYSPTPTSAPGTSYSPQGDRGTGLPYVPSAMPSNLKNRYPIGRK